MDLLPTHSFNCDAPLGPRKWTDDDDCQGGGLHHCVAKKNDAGCSVWHWGGSLSGCGRGGGRLAGRGSLWVGGGWNRGLPWEPNYPPSLFSVCFIPPVTPLVCFKLQMTNIQKRELDIFVFNNMFENIKINFKHPNNIYFHLIKFQTFIYSHIYSINEFEVHLTGIKAFAGWKVCDFFQTEMIFMFIYSHMPVPNTICLLFIQSWKLSIIDVMVNFII